MMTSSTTSRFPPPRPPFEVEGSELLEASILAARRAAAIACPPSCVADREESEPMSPPIGVRTAPMMQTSARLVCCDGVVGEERREGRSSQGRVLIFLLFLVGVVERCHPSFTARFLLASELDSQTRASPRHENDGTILLTDERRVVKSAQVRFGAPRSPIVFDRRQRRHRIGPRRGSSGSSAAAQDAVAASSEAGGKREKEALTVSRGAEGGPGAAGQHAEESSRGVSG